MIIFGPVKPRGFSICYWDPRKQKVKIEWYPLKLYHMRVLEVIFSSEQ